MSNSGDRPHSLRMTEPRLIGVYRVENADGVGPYRGPSGGSHPAIKAHGRYGTKSRETHPAPWEDGLDQRFYGRVFGFTSLESASAWFAPDELRRLDRDGYRLRRFWISPDLVDHGAAQVVFERKRAR